MNYDVKLFHDYEAITIDDLKDKTNSLLNLMAEEQRPLRQGVSNISAGYSHPALRSRLSFDHTGGDAVCNGQEHIYAHGGR